MNFSKTVGAFALGILAFAGGHPAGAQVADVLTGEDLHVATSAMAALEHLQELEELPDRWQIADWIAREGEEPFVTNRGTAIPGSRTKASDPLPIYVCEDVCTAISRSHVPVMVRVEIESEREVVVWISTPEIAEGAVWTFTAEQRRVRVTRSAEGDFHSEFLGTSFARMGFPTPTGAGGK